MAISGDYAPNPAANDTVGDTAELCCSRALAAVVGHLVVPSKKVAMKGYEKMSHTHNVLLVTVSIC